MQLNSSFAAGDVVNVVKHGRATVLGVDEDGRVHVQYFEDGSQYHVNPKKLRKLWLSSQRIVVCFYTIEFRHALVHNLDVSSSVVLEIGCHEGIATHMISKRSTFVLGLDVNKTVIQVARSRYPQLRFEVCDGGQIEECLSLSDGRDFNVVTIDVSGQAPLSLLLPILKAWADRYPKALIVVKNRRLYQRLAFGPLPGDEEITEQLQSVMEELLPLCEGFQRTDLSQEEREKFEETKRMWGGRKP